MDGLQTAAFKAASLTPLAAAAKRPIDCSQPSVVEYVKPRHTRCGLASER
jgi:hypothetical protein